MDQTILVSSAQKLIALLDDTPAKPRLAMWISFSDTNTQKLLIVPAKGMDDKREFYRIVAETISQHQQDMPELNVGMTEYASDKHPIAKGMDGFMAVTGIAAVHLGNNVFNGYFLPEGILIRSDFDS